MYKSKTGQPKRVFISDQRREIMCKCYETHMTTAEIIEQLNQAPPFSEVNLKLVREWARKLRLARDGSKLTPENTALIRQMMSDTTQQASYATMASRLGVSINTIKNWLHKLGYALERNWNIPKLPPELGVATRDTELTDWDTIKKWAVNNRIKPDSDPRKTIDQVNERRQKYGLPGYVLKVVPIDLCITKRAA